MNALIGVAVAVALMAFPAAHSATSESLDRAQASAQRQHGAVPARVARETAPQPARRIVTLAPHLTELVYTVGAGDRLVGVDAYSDYPPEAQKVARVGDAFQVDYERLLALKPDLVLVSFVLNDAVPAAQLVPLDARVPLPLRRHASGIIYRADKVDGMTGSWNDMGNPTADGRAYLLDDFQEVIGAGNLVNGAELNSVDPADVDAAKEWALGLKPKMRGFSTDDIQNMVSGNAWIHHGWNGDVVNIRNQVDNPENFTFQKCTEGIPLGTDCFAVPANAEHPGTALTFINFILDPENASKNINYMGYPMPYTGPDEAFASLVKDDPSINVTVEDLESGQQFGDLGTEGRRLWDQTWTEIKAG